MTARSPKTLFDKIWDAHTVRAQTDASPALLYIDLHLIHEVTSPQAFAELDARGLTVRRSDLTYATTDHSTPTAARRSDGTIPFATPENAAQVKKLQDNCAAHGIQLADLDSADQGIVHVMGPELGLTHPGMTIVCGDSHTATHGAFGALAFGIGTTEVGHVLASQCLLQNKPKTMRITVDGKLGTGVTAKDMILAIIAEIGAGGGTGYVIEYAGEAVRALTMEERMTVCNMSIEAGARAGLVAPDETTFQWLKDRRHAPEDFAAAVARWQELVTDESAVFHKEVVLDAAQIAPTVTTGAATDTGIPVTGTIPIPETEAQEKALAYMGFEPGQPIAGQPVNTVFIGSCTNGRLSDLAEAADMLRGHRVHEQTRMLVVPGSKSVKRAAEAEGLDQVFKAAGAEWREPGCSMCLAMNGDKGNPGDLIVSTSNRNFAGRQGPGVRTVLASPATAAASAIMGRITDPRTMGQKERQSAA